MEGNVKVDGVLYRFTLQQFILPQQMVKQFGLNTPLWTSDELADMPETHPHLIKFGILKKIT